MGGEFWKRKSQLAILEAAPSMNEWSQMHFKNVPIQAELLPARTGIVNRSQNL